MGTYSQWQNIFCFLHIFCSLGSHGGLTSSNNSEHAYFLLGLERKISKNLFKRKETITSSTFSIGADWKVLYKWLHLYSVLRFATKKWKQKLKIKHATVLYKCVLAQTMLWRLGSLVSRHHSKSKCLHEEWSNINATRQKNWCLLLRHILYCVEYSVPLKPRLTDIPAALVIILQLLNRSGHFVLVLAIEHFPTSVMEHMLPHFFHYIPFQKAEI